ncbi:hypothetical protein BGZ82_006748 [Podila clonocystis]|nr:hypothetical protein BGZ82_006748 [Podila clonocystis]
MIDTPELVFLVGQHLHPADLRRCILVSQLWREILIPCLWRELDDSERPWCQMFDEAESLDDGIDLPFDMDPRRQLSEMIHKYGRYIRRLKITHIWTLECCLQANLQGVAMLYWSIDIRECKYIHLDGSREVAIIQGLPSHLNCEEPDLDYIEDTDEWVYVSQCFWTLVCNNSNLTLVDLQPTEWSKVLKLESCNVLHPLLASLPRLRILYNLPMPTDSTLQLQNFAPNLDALTLADQLTAHDFLVVPTAENIHRNLRSLTLYGSLTLLQVCHISQMFPNLEHIRFLCWGRNVNEISYKALTLPIHLKSALLHQLEVCSLDWVLYPSLTISFPRLDSVSIANFSQFKQLNFLLRNCPTIRSIQVQSFARPSGIFMYGPQHQTADTVNSSNENNDYDNTERLFVAQNVRVVHINLNQTHVKESINCFWRTVPRLVEVSLRASNPPLLAALARCCPALQRVNMGTMCPWWSNGMSCSDAVSEMLRSCSDLRSLEGEGLVLSPMAIQDGGAWVCNKLEVLHLDITGFAYEASEAQEDDDEWRYALHHVVYDQLALLNRLRILDLSVVCSCNAPSHLPEQHVHLYHCHLHRRQTNHVTVGPLNTLQLTLASGLDHLSSLSQLEELGIHGVDHAIRKEELLWMQTHWPRLKWIQGVAPKIEEEEKTKVRTWYVEDGIPDFLARYPENKIDS